MENKGLEFVLTGSSARNLKRRGVNLLAGRAINQKMYPLTAQELAKDFDITKSLRYGHLPKACKLLSPKNFLKTYVENYIKEEIYAESVVRSLPNFTRFLEIASFSQGSTLNFSAISRESSVGRKAVENYFSILRDTLMSYEIPVFKKRAKRRLVQNHKFYFFDVGVYQSLQTERTSR